MTTLNEDLFNCSKEEFKEKINAIKLGENHAKAINYNIAVLTCPLIEKTKGGVILTQGQQELNKFKMSLGRVISKGSSVGEQEALRDLKHLEIGDYIFYNYHASGQPWKLAHVDLDIKVFADDMIREIVSQEFALAQLSI